MRGRPIAMPGAAILTAAFIAAADPVAAQEPSSAEADYVKWCAGCHGVDGQGQGPAARYMLPRPRDFTTALYQIRSTPSGALPTDEDIRRIIADGMPGTAMPGWSGHLSEGQIEGLVQYLKTFAPVFESQDPPQTVDIGSPPSVSEEGLAEGRAIFEKIQCYECHGMEGRGSGPSAPTLEDGEDLPIRAADLTENWHFNGGGTAEAIMTRFMTGLNGTPMPSNADLIDAEVVTLEQLWRVAQYVRSLSPEEPPEAREVIRAALVDTLPESVADSAWQVADMGYVPLVGQIIETPRWFAPMVDGVYVRALHDGAELAVLFEWHDPSETPDPEWAEWRAKVVAMMAPEDPAAAPVGEEGGEPEGAGAAQPIATTTADTAAADTLGGVPIETGAPGAPVDAFVVQFPTTIPEGMERPYFLMGSEENPVYLWHWESGPSGAREAIATGLAEIEALAAGGQAAGEGQGGLAWQATFDNGRWLLLIRRPLTAPGPEGRLQFEAGRAIPIALFAWDGSNGESGTRGAISTWYFLYLDQPTASTVYVVPALAMLLTAGLGVFVVVRAQRGH